MENIKDWCISRQLWWGHRIPAYFLPEGGYVVAETAEKALEIAKEKTGNASLTMADLRQDEDVLDTCFSSWLWPISLFNGINDPDNQEINYYYPTSDLVTGPDIIFISFHLFHQAGSLQVFFDLLTNIETVHTDIQTASLADRTVIIEYIDTRQIIFFAQHIVVYVMCRSHFQATGTKFDIHIVIFDNRNHTAYQGNYYFLSFEIQD